MTRRAAVSVATSSNHSASSRDSAACRASTSTTPAPNVSTSHGSSSCRTLLRGIARSWLLSSSRQPCPRSRSHASTSLRRASSSGRIDLTRPRINRRETRPARRRAPAAAAPSPPGRRACGPPPRASRRGRPRPRSRTDIGRCAPHLRWKFCGPAPRPPRRRRRLSNATSEPGRQIAAERLVAVRRRRGAGGSDARARPAGRRGGAPARPGRSASAVESAPPDTAATRTSPAPKSACSETVCWTRSRSVDIRARTARPTTAGRPSGKRGGWCWCRRADSNRRPSAYETLALTT